MTAQIRFTSRAEGDFSPSPASAELAERRRKVLAGEWTELCQVHGNLVALVEKPGHRCGERADAAVTRSLGAVISVRTADCAPLALIAKEGAISVVHAGWRGAVAGVIPKALESLQKLGARNISAFLGPCIRPECYEFDPLALEELASGFGKEAKAYTSWGTPALSLPALVRKELERSGVQDLQDSEYCTSCESARWFSQRIRKETQRHALAACITNKPV